LKAKQAVRMIFLISRSVGFIEVLKNLHENRNREVNNNIQNATQIENTPTLSVINLDNNIGIHTQSVFS